MRRAHLRSLHDTLLVLGLVLSPFTGLRIWKIGPSEMLLLFWMIGSFLRFQCLFSRSSMTTFWVIYWLAYTLGWLRASFIGRLSIQVSTSVSTMLFITGLSLALDVWVKKTTQEEQRRLITTTARIGTYLYALIFLYAKFIAPTLFGISLWYAGSRFTGGALNPHQFAGAAVPLILCFAANQRKISSKYLLGLNVTVLITAFMATLATESSTLVAAYLALISILFFTRIVKSRNQLWTVVVIFFCGSLLLALSFLFHEAIIYAITSFITTDPNGLGRTELWIAGLKESLNSSIVGFGPLAYVPYGIYRAEAHNTYIQVLLNAGVIGLSAFLVMVVRVLRRKSRYNMIIIYFLLYGIAGYVVRRPLLWFFLALAARPLDSDVGTSSKPSHTWFATSPFWHMGLHNKEGC